MQLHLNIPWKYATEIIDTEWTNLQIGGGNEWVQLAKSVPVECTSRKIWQIKQKNPLILN